MIVVVLKKGLSVNLIEGGISSLKLETIKDEIMNCDKISHLYYI